MAAPSPCFGLQACYRLFFAPPPFGAWIGADIARAVSAHRGRSACAACLVSALVARGLARESVCPHCPCAPPPPLKLGSAQVMPARAAQTTGPTATHSAHGQS